MSNVVLRELTRAEALVLLRRAVAEKGADYIYVNPDGETVSTDGTSSCSYFDHDDQPSCIVGHVFAYAGATRDDVKEDVSVLGQHRAVDRFEVDGFWFDMDTARTLLVAQQGQDSGMPWGEALAMAVAVLDDWE